MQARAASEAESSSELTCTQIRTTNACCHHWRTAYTPDSSLNPPPPPQSSSSSTSSSSPCKPSLGWRVVHSPSSSSRLAGELERTLSLVCYMLVVAVWRHPTAISIAWSSLQLVAQGGMPRDLDSLVAEVKTLLCLLVALHCFQDLLERLSRHWWMHAHVWSMGEGVGRAIGCFECRLTRRLT